MASYILVNPTKLTHTQPYPNPARSIPSDQIEVDLDVLLPNFNDFYTAPPEALASLLGDTLLLTLPEDVLTELAKPTADYVSFIDAYLQDEEIDDHLDDLAGNDSKANRLLLLLTTLMISFSNGQNLKPARLTRQFERFLKRIDLSKIDPVIIGRLDTLLSQYSLPISVMDLVTGGDS